MNYALGSAVVVPNALSRFRVQIYFCIRTYFSFSLFLIKQMLKYQILRKKCMSNKMLKKYICERTKKEKGTKNII